MDLRINARSGLSSRGRASWVVGLLVGVSSAFGNGCGGAAKPDGGEQASIAKALAYESKEKNLAKEVEAAEAKALAAAHQAKRAAEEAKKAEIESLTVAKDGAGGSVKAACETMLEAYEAFIRAGQDAEVVMNWINARKKIIPQRRANCLQLKEVRAVTCMTHAFEKAPQTWRDVGDEGARLLFARCAEKYGGGTFGDSASSAQ